MSSAPFPGPFGALPEAGEAAILRFPPPSDTPGAVRFVGGFEPFADFAEARGVDPAHLAVDFSALWRFVTAHPVVGESPALAESAALFVGNAIAVAHPAATWRATPELEVGTRTRSLPVAGLLQGMRAHPERLPEFLDMLATWPQEDEDDEEMRALDRDGATRALTVPPVAYRRPPLPEREYVDGDGRVIPYGSRWSDGAPPEDAYSRESHPERFAPLLLVVDALVEHLHDAYLVEVRRELDPQGAPRIVVEPSAGATIVLTPTPPCVRVEAGALFDAVVPSCTCDACDENADTAATELENTVLGIAAGGLREVFPVGRRAWVHTQLVFEEGSRSSGSGPAPDLPAEVRDEKAAVLGGLDDGWWPAWPLRVAPSS